MELLLDVPVKVPPEIRIPQFVEIDLLLFQFLRARGREKCVRPLRSFEYSAQARPQELQG
jgi:hypothetical protein